MAVETLLRFRENARRGEGPTSVKEELDLSRKIAEENKRLEKQEITVSELAELFYEDKARTAPGIRTLAPRTIHEYRLNIERDVIPEIGDLKAKSIERDHIADIFEKIAKRGALVQSNRTLAACSALFNWALKKGKVKYNPCALMEKFAEKARTRVLTEPEKKEVSTEKPRHEEIKTLWEKLTENLSKTEARILLLCILLGARPGEICKMKWEDIDSNNWWSLEFTKAHVTLDCYLTRTALDIIGKKQAEGFVFPMKTDNSKPIPETRLSRYVNNNNYFDLPPWRPMDLRRTFATLAKMFNFDDIIVNIAQARKDSSILRKHYDKRTYYSELKSLYITVESELLRIIEKKTNTDSCVVNFLDFKSSKD